MNEKEIAEIRENMPELPNKKMLRYVKEHGLNDSEAFIITSSPDKAALYDECVRLQRCSIRSAANRIVGEITKFMNDTGKSISETGITAEELCEICSAHEKGLISSSGAKTALEELIAHGGRTEEIIKRMGLEKNTDIAYLSELADKVISENERSAADYRNGKKSAISFLIGQAMKASKGRADPSEIRNLIENKLKKGE